MNQKDRIIELVRNNVLTMEEALQLLEAASKQEASTVDNNNYTVDYQVELENELNNEQQVTNLEENSEQTQATFERLSEQLEKKQAALTIAKQRLRELEIFAELDELTPEMQTQQVELTEKMKQLEVEIEELTIEVDITKQNLRHNVQDEFKRVVETTTDKVTNVAKEFTKEMTKEGRNLQETITKSLKDFAASFDMKDISLTVPWIKSTVMQHQFRYEVTDLAQVDISLLNGDLIVETHDEAGVIVDAAITFYGKEEMASIETFEALSTIDVSNERLLFHVKSPKIASDLRIKLPKSCIHEVRLTATNGDLVVNGVEANDLYVDSKNGEVNLSHTNANFVEFAGFNGDVLIEDSMIADLVYHVLNGDFKYKGAVGNLSADVINGDLIISKQDVSAANLNIKTVSGDVKVSIPESVNLEIDATSSLGDIKQRLANIEQLKKGRRFERYLNEQAPIVKIEVKTTSGDIYLKDKEYQQ